VVVYGQVLNPHYAVKDWLIWRLLPIWAYALFFNAACVSGGAAALRLLFGRRKLPALEWLLQSMAVGMVFFVLGLYVAGAFCLMRPWVAILLPLLLLATGWRAVPELIGGLREWRASIPQRSLLGRVASALASGWGAVALALMYLGALSISAINFDATWYHIPIAQDYARIGCIVPFPGENHRAYPHLTSMLHAWALLVPGLRPIDLHWMLSLHLEYSIVVWRIVGVAAAMRWMLGDQDRPGLWAVFFLFPSVFVYDQNIGGSADHVLGFFAAPILLAAARALSAFDWRCSALLGVVLAGHLLTKYQAVYLIVSVAAISIGRWLYLMARVLIARRRGVAQSGNLDVRALLLGPAILLTVTVAVSSPHFIKNTVFYGNPVYPLAQGIFTSSHPHRGPGVYEQGGGPAPFAPQGHGVERVLWIGQKLVDYSFETANRDFTKHRPYMGALFSLLVPCLLFVTRPGRIAFCVLMGVIAFFVWGNVAANDRYLLAFLDLFIAVGGALVVRVWEMGWIARAGLLPLLGLQLIWAAAVMFYYGNSRVRAGIDLITAGYDGRAAARFGGKGKQAQITQATPPDARILSRNYKGLLGLDRMVLSDIRAAQEYVTYSHLRNARELWKDLKSKGITHLLYPDGQRLPWRWNNTVLFGELFQHAENVQRFSELVLGEMPHEPPPAPQPYLVLACGLKGYPNGLYRVEQLDVDNSFPYRVNPPPIPAFALDGSDPVALLAKANALAIRDTCLPQLPSQELNASFRRVEKWKGYQLYLRPPPQ
jgi:hypothetical protein